MLYALIESWQYSDGTLDTEVLETFDNIEDAEKGLQFYINETENNNTIQESKSAPYEWSCKDPGSYLLKIIKIGG